MPVGVAGGELVVELLDMGVDAANVDIDIGVGVGVDAVVGVEAWHEKLQRPTGEVRTESESEPLNMPRGRQMPEMRRTP